MNENIDKENDTEENKENEAIKNAIGKPYNLETKNSLKYGGTVKRGIITEAYTKKEAYNHQCAYTNEMKLKNLIIHSMKELGEIAETLVKKDKDRPEHWINELCDLCAFGIQPMLELARIEFPYAVEVGIRRKLEKLQDKNKD